MSKNWLYLLIIVLFSFLGMKGLFHPGLFTAHDIWHQVVRFYYYSQAVKDGQFPPLWIGQLANGFGYPLFFFSYNFPWIIGTAMLKIGFDITNTIKALFFLSYLGSGLTMYFFVSRVLKDKLSGLLSSILYLWLPYHFLIIFVSASLGIAFIFTFLPLIFLGIYLIKEKSKSGIPILGLGISGVILSHIMHLAFLFPLILIFSIWAFKNSKIKINFIKNIVFGLIVGILISSFYLIPATYYNQFTRVHQEEGITKLYERNFINLKQLIYSKWGYSPIINNAKNGEISFQLGIAQWISILILSFLIIFKKISKNYQTLGIYLLFSFTLYTLLMLSFSAPLWKILVKFVSLDFPFRLLLPISFIASFCAGILIVSISKFKKLIFIFLVIITIYTNRNHINVNQYTNFPISTYLNLETEITTNTFNEYLPIQAEPKLLNKPWNEIKGENLYASNTLHKTNILFFDMNVAKKGNVSVGQFYFPGQMLYLDNIKTQFNVDKSGLINFTIPEGKHIVEVKYQETLLIKISKYFTLIGLLIMVLLLFRIRKIST